MAGYPATTVERDISAHDADNPLTSTNAGQKHVPAETAKPADLVPGFGMTWEGRARMAFARRAAGLDLNELDRAAMRVAPAPCDGISGAPGWPVPPAPRRLAVMPDSPSGLVTTYRPAKIGRRRCAWVAGGQGVTDTGERFPADLATVGGLLDSLPADVRTVHILGGRPGDTLDGFRHWSTAAGSWGDAGHYLENLMLPLLRYRQGQRRVDVQRAAMWLGDGPYTIDQAREAFDLVGQLVAERFHGAALLATPATTGRHLFLATIPKGREWPVLTDELQELIRHTSGQGRVEFFPPAGDTIDGLAELDGRFMYAALCRELPAGVPVRGKGEPAPDAQGRQMARGRFLARWEVPAGWDHVGLLPMREGDETFWPATPGEAGRGWVDAWEVEYARRWGWHVIVDEHLTWPDKGDPLGPWADRLVSIRDAIGLRQLDPTVADLARGAVRRLLVQAIGAFVGRPQLTTRTAPVDEPGRVPEGAVGLRIEGDHFVWGEQGAVAWPDLAHPEWAAAVWARCRVRLLHGPGGTGALHLPRGDLLALSTDALYTTAPPPAWPDDGKPGRLRAKAWWPGPHPAPANLRPDLLALRDRLRAG